jgi:hypothetical protein
MCLCGVRASICGPDLVYHERKPDSHQNSDDATVPEEVIWEREQSNDSDERQCDSEKYRR